MSAGKLAGQIGYGLKYLLTRKQRPYLLGMVITERCNLNCFYCQSRGLGSLEFSFAQAQQCLREAYARGHRQLYLTGGEPMMWRDGEETLAGLVACARQIGFTGVLVYTNGTFPLDIRGCQYVVSLDGPRRIHDSIRPDTYDRVMQNAASAQGRVFASITISKRNSGCIGEFIREISARGIFDAIWFNLLTHSPSFLAEHGLSANERTRVLDALWRLKRQGFPVVLSRAAYRAMRSGDWRRPIKAVELVTLNAVFTCCRDVNNPALCEQCGYAACAEVSQILALKPSAVWQGLVHLR